MELDTTRPIWLQLTDEFRRRIAVGDWPPGAKVPSVRELAGELRVNPNTVQRALAELDREGLTGSERTAGRFVLIERAEVLDARQTLADQLATAFIAGAKDLDLGVEEAVGLVRERWAREENHGGR